MSRITNSDLIKHVLSGLFYITGRRATESLAALLIATVLEHLEKTYDFLSSVSIKTAMHGHSTGTVSVSSEQNVNSVNPARVAKSIESIIRIISLDFRSEAGLFFVKELKERIRDEYLAKIKNYGVDLDIIQLEQHYIYRQRKRKKTLSPFKTNKPEDASVMQYDWGNVAYCEYKESVCLIYDDKGKLLDKLHLDKIVERHIKELSEFDKKLVEIEEPKPTSKDDIKVDEQQHEFLKMLYSRDMDSETAIWVMKISELELEYIVSKLLKLGLLQYVSDNEVEITQKGIDIILAEKTKKLKEPGS
jgi:hypothetical protein